MIVCIDDCLLRWLSALMIVCFDDCLLWWLSALMIVCFNDCLLWGLSASIIVCFDNCLLWWLSASMIVCFDDCLLRWLSASMIVYFDDYLLWWFPLLSLSASMIFHCTVNAGIVSDMASGCQNSTSWWQKTQVFHNKSFICKLLDFYFCLNAYHQLSRWHINVSGHSNFKFWFPCTVQVLSYIL